MLCHPAFLWFSAIASLSLLYLAWMFGLQSLAVIGNLACGPISLASCGCGLDGASMSKLDSSPLVGSVFGPKQENSKLLSLSHRHCQSPNLLKISIKWAEGPQDDRELARSMRKITRNLQIISMFVPIWRVIPQIRREHPQNLKN